MPKGRTARGFPPRLKPIRREEIFPCGLRHSRAPSREAAVQKSRGNRPFLQQAAPSRKLPIKHASTASNFRKVTRPYAATFGMAEALVTETVPSGMQASTCLQIGRQLISFSALSNWEDAADMGIPVTTIE
ncbi:hypothetical protein QRQ56_08385 [Bradyrhizobium sp. U531]|uniref:hypothetical protein n=1 Tax=Bradyrhizobium sp. U531 TaxID=3053458 RepID=UPI003F43C4F7